MQALEGDLRLGGVDIPVQWAMQRGTSQSVKLGL